MSMKSVVALLLVAAVAQATHPGEKTRTVEIDAELPPDPVFQYTLEGEAVEQISLEVVGFDRNDVIDYEPWFREHYYPAETYHNGGVNDAIRGEVPTPEVPSSIVANGRTLYLYQVIYGWDTLLATFGQPPNRFGVVLDPTVLVSWDYEGESPRWAVDFLSWGNAPGAVVDPEFVFQAVRWAEEWNGILYVSHFHRTYAESSGGLNACITAIDLDDMSVLWRSQPLVSNSENFLVIGDTIVTGYGFTNEADYVYLLDRRTGEVYDRVDVRSAPEYLVHEGEMLYVRCYDADYEFEIERRH
ncbi:hypothetical protein JW921_04000 [Candidatus Fermentibacterales bacterium]|nr:hypothetical protein [Candidatus Fermentibacterales bacterium]